MEYRISREQITYHEPVSQVRLPTRQFEDNPYAHSRGGYDGPRNREETPYKRKQTSIGDYAQGGGTPNSLKECAGGKTVFI